MDNKFINAISSELKKNSGNTIYQSIDKVSSDSKFSNVNFFMRIESYALAITKSFPSGAGKIIEFIRKFHISVETLHSSVIIVSAILLALQIYLIYTTYQLSAAIGTIPAFSVIASSNSSLATVTMGSSLFYLLLFLYILRNKSDNYRPEIVRYFLNLNFIIFIASNTFMGNVNQALSIVSYNTVNDTTTLPSVTSIISTQTSIFSIISLVTILYWIFSTSIDTVIDVLEYAGGPLFA